MRRMDNNQSIYAFRGADIDFICESLIKDGFEQYVLEQNYRSTSTIVEASNAVVDNNPKIIDKKLSLSKRKVLLYLLKKLNPIKMKLIISFAVLNLYYVMVSSIKIFLS